MAIDPLEMLFRQFKLPTMASQFAEMIEQAERDNWGYRKLLLQLCESESADRHERRQQRLLKQSELPQGKTLESLDDSKLPVKVRRILPTLLEGGFVDRAENVLAFGLPGRGETHYLVHWDVNWCCATDIRFTSRLRSNWSNNY